MTKLSNLAPEGNVPPATQAHTAQPDTGNMRVITSVPLETMSLDTDHLHPGILRGYGGAITAHTVTSVTVRFPDVPHMTSWIAPILDTEYAMRVIDMPSNLRGPVSVEIREPHGALPVPLFSATVTADKRNDYETGEKFWAVKVTSETPNRPAETLVRDYLAYGPDSPNGVVMDWAVINLVTLAVHGGTYGA